MNISVEQKEYILNNYNNMFSLDISNEIGVSRNTVLKCAHENGLSSYAKRTPIASMYDGEYMKAKYMESSYADIGRVVGLSAKQVEGWLRNHALNKVSKHRSFNTKYFEKIDANTKAYYLGFIYADGWITHNYKRSSDGNVIRKCGAEFGMELQEQDSYILERLSEEIGGVHNISHYHKSILIHNNKNVSESNMSKIRVYSNEFVECLHMNGIDYNKTSTGKFPIVDDDMFVAFLKGYIDGDGCIYKQSESNLVVHITSCSKGILEYVNEMSSKIIGVTGRIYSENDRKYRIMWFRHDDVRKLLDAIYSCDTPELIRKRSIYDSFYGLSSQ